MKPSLLIIQGGDAHTETIGAFLAAFQHTHEITIYFPHDGINSIDDYRICGYSFSYIKDFTLLTTFVQNNSCDVIFNTARELNWNSRECRLVTAYIAQMKSILCLCHGPNQIQDRPPYINVLTTPLMSSSIEFILPVYPLYPSQFKIQDLRRPTSIMLVGGADTSFLRHKDLVGLLELVKFADQHEDLSVTLFSLSNRTDALFEYIARSSESFRIECDCSTEEIVSFAGRQKSFIWPCVRDDSRYLRDSWSGSVAFGVNNDLPILSTKALAAIYDLPGELSYNSSVIELADAVTSYDEHEYVSAIERIREMRTHRVASNAQTLKNLILADQRQSAPDA